jgi:hypothetical protein
LALDLSVATGKPVEAISNALGRAYDGNTLALSRLGLGLDENLLKSKDNEAIITSLETTYGRFAEGAAETAAVKFERIRIATDEAKESIGAALLPVVERLMNYILITVVPNLETFINALTGQGSLTEATEDGTAGAFKFGEQVKRVINTIIGLKTELIAAGVAVAGLFVVSKISAAVVATIALIKTLITAYNALKASAIVAGVATAFALNPLLGVGAVALAASVLAGANALSNRSNVDTSGLGAPATGAIPFASGFAAPSGSPTIVPTVPSLSTLTAGGGGGGVASAAKVAATAAAATSGSAFPFGTSGVNTNTLAGIMAASGTTINLTVNGALDKEGTARTIVETLNNSYYRGTGGATALVAI